MGGKRKGWKNSASPSLSTVGEEKTDVKEEICMCVSSSCVLDHSHQLPFPYLIPGGRDWGRVVGVN